jgi:GrpB-like predicted nucleotidyltransferase (UPF0157 family)
MPSGTEIEHVGSTSIPDVAARPNIAIMVALRSMADANSCAPLLEAAGYESLGGSGVQGRTLLRRTDVRESSRLSYAVHLTQAGSEYWDEHIAFRDFLRAQPAVAGRYVELKRRLATEYPNDREAYGKAKEPFIKIVLGRARSGPPRRVIIADYDPQWPAMFEAERSFVRQAIGGAAIEIEHVGSTVSGLAAKPIIDIMIAVSDLDEARERCVKPISDLGYHYVPEYEAVMPERLYFNKGEPHSRHIHMVELDSSFWKRHLLFRDYLRDHPAVAQEYATLKKLLAKEHGTDMDGYTEGKSEFIIRVEAKAKLWAERER